jgi:Domain of unknown function (DUF4184)
MPFTVAHAAAFLPFRKLNLVWSAFIIGSMAPDFPYVIGSTKYHALGHYYPGLVYFTIPASVLALWLFHNVVKRPVVGLLPNSMQVRLTGQMGKFSFRPATRFGAIMMSILLGIATHVVWDDFTHSYTWAWYRFQWLRGLVRLPVVGLVSRHAVLQYASTVVGVVALAVWVWLWYRKAQPASQAVPAHSRSRFPLAVAMFAVACVAGLLRAVLVIGVPSRLLHPDHFMLVFSVTALALAFWQLLLYCVLVSTHQLWTLS